MKQVVIIHGGSSYNSHQSYLDSLTSSTLDYERLKYAQRWSNRGASEQLTDFDVLLPAMPNKDNAVYDEWRIVFEKLTPHLKDGVQLVGYSLGAMFLAKYCNETVLPVKARRIILVAGAYANEQNEDLGSFQVTSAVGLQDSTDEVHLFHSKDDFVVPFSELAKFQADLPEATSHVFDDRGHFLQPHLPELYSLLQQK